MNMNESQRQTAPSKFPGSFHIVRLRKSRYLEEADGIISICGHGMSPMFKDGDEVFFQYADHLEPGEIGIIKYNGVVVIRQYYPTELRSFRPDLEAVHLEPGGHCEIMARVLGVVTDDMRLTEEETNLLNSEDPPDDYDSNSPEYNSAMRNSAKYNGSPVSPSNLQRTTQRVRSSHSRYPARDNKIYQACVVEGRTQKSVAQELGISTARVGQLLKRIRVAHDEAEMAMLSDD